MTDAFGASLLDHLASGEPVLHVVERDDGHVNPFPAHMYFTDGMLGVHEAAVLDEVGERVLDVGVGAGRHALRLQGLGHRVVGIDPSPGAVRVCRRRGLKRVKRMRVEDIDPSLGTFDSFLMLGHNIGLLRSRSAGPRILRRLARVAAPDARILGTALDPFKTTDPDHRAYHRRNRARGRMAGQVRLRVRYKTMIDPWFDYLHLSPAQLRAMVGSTPWAIERIEREGPHYGVVLRLK